MKRLILSAILSLISGLCPAQATVVRDASGKIKETHHKTHDGYIIRDASGVYFGKVVENELEKITYDKAGRVVSRERKPTKTKTK